MCGKTSTFNDGGGTFYRMLLDECRLDLRYDSLRLRDRDDRRLGDYRFLPFDLAFKQVGRAL